MRRIEDKAVAHYTGERAMEDEVLPATPRKETHNKQKYVFAQGSTPGSSPRSQGGSPRSEGGERDGNAQNAQVALADAAAEG
mmetsp:Transcript_86004/g.170737  ORF Transcript_86004/g.170737 Transcript_86004/m.170737 type:complete len:82 (+) Transcript_86004:1-246(+)